MFMVDMDSILPLFPSPLSFFFFLLSRASIDPKSQSDFFGFVFSGLLWLELFKKRGGGERGLRLFFTLALSSA